MSDKPPITITLTLDSKELARCLEHHVANAAKEIREREKEREHLESLAREELARFNRAFKKKYQGHDGKIGNSCFVGRVKHTNAIYITAGPKELFLGPSEALSLLAWLNQEKETLETLGEEAAGVEE